MIYPLIAARGGVVFQENTIGRGRFTSASDAGEIGLPLGLRKG
jgi:hypothetical protein